MFLFHFSYGYPWKKKQKMVKHISPKVKQQNANRITALHLPSNEPTQSKTASSEPKIVKPSRASQYFSRQQQSNQSRRVFITPVTTQCSTNVMGIKHEKTIDFLQSMMKPQDYHDLNCLVATNFFLGIHPKQFDDLFAGIVQPYNPKWQAFQQRFFGASPERREAALRARPEGRLQMAQLTKYLERYQVLQLREEFPHVADENILMHIRQTKYLPTIKQAIQKQEELRLKSLRPIVLPKPPSIFLQGLPSDECNICCLDVPKVQYACGHRYCCATCTQQLKTCPVCRAIITQ